MEGASEGVAVGTDGATSKETGVMFLPFPGSPCPGATGCPPPPAAGSGIPPGSTVPGSGGRPDSISGVTPGMMGTTGAACSTPPRVMVCACSACSSCSSFCKNNASASATLLDDDDDDEEEVEDVRGIVEGDQVGWDCCNSQEIAVGRGVLAKEGRLVAPLRGCWDAVRGLGFETS